MDRRGAERVSGCYRYCVVGVGSDLTGCFSRHSLVLPCLSMKGSSLRLSSPHFVEALREYRGNWHILNELELSYHRFTSYSQERPRFPLFESSWLSTPSPKQSASRARPAVARPVAGSSPIGKSGALRPSGRGCPRFVRGPTGSELIVAQLPGSGLRHLHGAHPSIHLYCRYQYYPTCAPSTQCRVAFPAMLGGQPTGNQTKPMLANNHLIQCTRSGINPTNTRTSRKVSIYRHSGRP